MSFNIAIDGPAGAGNSTIAKQLAKDLGVVYVDTGAMYRAFAYYFITNNISAEDEAAISAACPNVTISLTYEDGVQNVWLNGENVSSVIRQEEVGKMASATSVYPVVRTKLMELQQNLAKTTNVIMDGRDIGTVVLPNADVKIYLTATVEERAKRRYMELIEKGQDADLEKIKEDIRTRDYQDMNRTAAPLKQAEDAVLIDSSSMTIQEVLECIVDAFQESLKLKG